MRHQQQQCAGNWQRGSSNPGHNTHNKAPARRQSKQNRSHAQVATHPLARRVGLQDRRSSGNGAWRLLSPPRASPFSEACLTWLCPIFMAPRYHLLVKGTLNMNETKGGLIALCQNQIMGPVAVHRPAASPAPSQHIPHFLGMQADDVSESGSNCDSSSGAGSSREVACSDHPPWPWPVNRKLYHFQ